MTLRAELAGLLVNAGLSDVDVDEAVADEQLRSSVYRRVVLTAAGSANRAGDRAIVGVLLRDPIAMKGRTAVVLLVDSIARKAGDPAEFRRWAAGILPEIDRLAAGKDRDFLLARVRDWSFRLSIEDGKVPSPDELAGVTDWMQRTLAETTASRPVLALLAGSGRTEKIRNIAKNRAGTGGAARPR
ncbi:hypothetical protein [Amycolatopsis samaneae]|uniref:Uncharacterized protein n=1 Tax=Amycolatopsis samaneae TaxID=664691 RepID=A0ABW5GUJ5_9PSEU